MRRAKKISFRVNRVGAAPGVRPVRSTEIMSGTGRTPGAAPTLVAIVSDVEGAIK